MFGLQELALLIGSLGVAWGMWEYAPALFQRALRRAGPQSAPEMPSRDDTPAPRPATLPDAPAGAMPTQLWRDMLAESPHLLIYGPSKAGKSTLAQAIVAMFDGCEYVVIDPLPNKPGERKWGGIDFVTLDDDGVDEYASIKRALAAVQAEDARRRSAMRTETPRQLIVIIDEVLALVDALGKADKEPVISQFIRTMGYSARHRNIKIVLLGQGKNLKDLGLDSSTARNNYAMVRVARDPSTNVRSAYIVADDKEVAIELRFVPQLAQAATGRANLWLEHRGCAVTPDADRMLERLLGGIPTPPAQPALAWTAQHVQVAAWLVSEPDISNREIARRLYPGTDGGGSYSVKAKELRDAVTSVTVTSVTPLQNGQNGTN